MQLRYPTWLAIIGVLVVVAAWITFDSKHFPINQGLDLAGGVRVVLQLQPDPKTGQMPEGAQDQVVKVVENRVNKLGVSEPIIQPKGSDQVIVELAQNQMEQGRSLDKRRAVTELLKPAHLEFYHFKDVVGAQPTGGGVAPNSNARWVSSSGGGMAFEDRRWTAGSPTPKTLSFEEARRIYLDYKAKGKEAELGDDWLYNPKNVILTGSNLVPGRAQAHFGQGTTSQVVTSLELNAEGTRLFRDFTENHVHEYLGIVYNDRLESMAQIEEPIRDGHAQITHNNGKLEEAVEQANLLNSGALPVPLKIAQTSEVEATLGADSVRNARVAGLVGLGAVALFMMGYYLLPGVLAVLALLCYALFTFAIFKVLGVVLTLPGIAGFILSVGMAVDANILIFERLKEELKAGKTLHAAIEAGFKRAWTSIFDSNMTTLITCFILVYYGNGPVKGFAVTLAIGVIVSMFTAITVSRNLLHAVVQNEWAQKASVFGVDKGWFRYREGRGLKIIGKRSVYFTFSGLLLVPGIIFLLMGGLKPGIEFTGGMQFRYELPKRASRAQVEKAFANAGHRDAFAQISVEEGKYQALVQTRDREISEAERTGLERQLQRQIGAGVRQLEFSQVGAAISNELKWNAFLSVLLASVFIALYLAFRFATAGFATGLRYGVSAVIALIHDSLVVLGLFAVMGKLRGWEIDSAFITAILTIIGFSVHDTIVIFDRIRENLKTKPKDTDYEDLVDDSINQTLARSVNTSMTVIITLFALLLFGGPVIRLFTVALLVGIGIGTYSSIFVAPPILVLWEQSARRRKGLAARGRRMQAADVKPLVDPSLRTRAAVGQPRNGGDGEVAEGETAVKAPRPAATAGGGPAKVRPKRKRRF